ncbi:NYN domain-containing protein [Candidatus Chloroploca sp. M-50]|uniref:NYN domain-containing protein n=1 Tax=Candidatus Chloroploca mongolica TaxID=2528176 RepID=A0ABS4DGH4_9CHLR|nr:NYN domain-containing protein [Candidatus Chloroploca mongolica]MBP1468544.1 NYN domain-containing protein [Candidatus Chloroploca mongolica]
MPYNPKLVAKIEAEEPSLKLAVLIDADNAQPAKFASILKEIATLGEATVKRIYGDFTSPQSAQWRKVLREFGIKPIQQFAYTTGKNATDSTMIIDAMDLLYTRRFDGFCLLSSDSDFTGLAMRLREEGVLVYGFGDERTPQAFRKVCHKFITVELLETQEVPVEVSDVTTLVKSKGTSAAKGAPLPPPDAPVPAPVTLPKPVAEGQPVTDDAAQLLRDALANVPSDEEGWSTLAAVGSYLMKIKPDFDPRRYGFKKLGELIRTQFSDLVDVAARGEPGAKVVYVRLRKAK